MGSVSVWFREPSDALIADVDGGAGDELAHLVLALAAERTDEPRLAFRAHCLADALQFLQLLLGRLPWLAQRLLLLDILGDDVVAEVETFVADGSGGGCRQSRDLRCRLPAKCT